MKIGINGSFLRKPWSGIGQVTWHVLEELSRQIDANELPGELSGAEFVVYVEDAPGDFVHLSKRIQIRSFLPSWWKRDDLVRKWWWERFSLPSRAKRDGCDALLSLYQSATIASKSLWHVMVVHDMIPRLLEDEYLNNMRKRFYQSALERAMREANRVVTVSECTRNDIVKYLGVDGDRIVVAPIDIDPLFRQEISEEMSRKTLEKYRLQPGYIYAGGGLEKRKNIEGLLRAYRLLADRYRQIDKTNELPPLVISGKLMPQLAPLITDVDALIQELELQDKVRALGYVEQEELPSLYANAKLFVYPSRYEGFGMPLLEAMSVGTPAVSSKESSLPEVGGDAVAYMQSCEVEDIAEAVDVVLRDDALLRRLAIAEKERSAMFSWELFIKNVLKQCRV